MILSRRIKTLGPFLISVSPSIPVSRRYRPFSSSFVNPSRLPFPPSSFSPSASRNIATDQMPPPSSDSSVTQSSRPPTEPIPPEGCDYEHWLVVMEPPNGFPLRDEIVQGYVETLAMVLGSKEEAKRSMYSVSTKYYYAFGCKVSQELSYKIKSLPNVRWVLPDSYLHVKDKDYGESHLLMERLFHMKRSTTQIGSGIKMLLRIGQAAITGVGSEASQEPLGGKRIGAGHKVQRLFHLLFYCAPARTLRRQKRDLSTIEEL